jgi:Tfp pilus assembly protein PilX
MHARQALLIPAAAAILAAAGCASSSTSTRTGPTPNPEASASFSSAAAARSSAEASFSSATAAAASSAANTPCTTKACIAQDAEQSLPGAVAADNSVITKATCYKRTVVHHAAAKTYTVQCTAYYSDGTSVTGYANLLLDQNKITWEPTS